ncbi:hypothetical protein CGZ94_00390 [Enemella evansiae]|uniref:DUF3817 domain-containing protein n=1 Tax=Enemella evansiae TaxID=2016499 RepID=A0A255GQ04_9ACTN|nr:hypothetical protein CGZ95_09720 [Enemella evansiae]OYO02725.1 hypothetical protein CGZ97_13870 [Enemella evansiae]OYO03041.1 hypothetical protein CGZ96_02230 [Enemella evansiae]OYO12327.1 hypothetical protein CGZ98_08160 [Enemella evansiae]OYO14234.1 hypothetical protein BI335_13255 [Enemella evansiae]
MGETVDNPRAVRAALLRYRVMAYVVGVLLVVLICIGMPLKYLAPDPTLNELGGKINTVLGIGHGWLYMALLVTAYDLGRRVKWAWKRLLGIALAGTVPFLSFVAERYATKDVQAKLAAADAIENQAS